MAHPTTQVLIDAPCLRSVLSVSMAHAMDSIAEESWQDLWECAVDSNVYQTYDWYRSFERHFGLAGKIQLILVRQGERLVGACPLMFVRQQRFGIFRHRILTFLSSFSPAYPLDQGPLIARDADQAAVLGAMARAITRLAGISTIEFELCEPGSLASQLLQRVAEILDHRVSRVAAIESHQVDLPGDLETLIGSLGGRTRRNVRHTCRKFETLGQTREHRQVQTMDELLEMLATMRTQKRERFDSTGRHSTFEDDRFDAFLHEVALALWRRGRLIGLVARVDGRIVATQLIFKDEHQHIYSYNSSSDPEFTQHRLHYLLSIRRFEEAIRLGYRRIDLSTGHAAHKEHWSRGNTRTLWQSRVVLRPEAELLWRLKEKLAHWHHERVRATIRPTN